MPAGFGLGFAFLCVCSGQTIFDNWFITMFNLIFTAFPLGARACIDQDLRKDDGIFVDKLMPFLYNDNKEYPLFNFYILKFNFVNFTLHKGYTNYYFI